MKKYLLLVMFLSFFLKFTLANALLKNKVIDKHKEKDFSDIEKQIQSLKQSIKDLHNSNKGGKEIFYLIIIC